MKTKARVHIKDLCFRVAFYDGDENKRASAWSAHCTLAEAIHSAQECLGSLFDTYGDMAQEPWVECYPSSTRIGLNDLLNGISAVWMEHARDRKAPDADKL